MPFSRPNLKALVDRAMADINGRLVGSDARLSVATLNVLAFVNSGAANGLYGYLDWQADQLMIDRCDEDHLARYADIWKVPRKNATPATGAGTATAFAPATVPSGTLLQRIDGAQFLTTTETAVAIGNASIPIVAALSGIAGDTAAGTQLTLATPIPGLNTVITVGAAGINDGTEQETIDSWRARLLARIRQPPSGGTPDDYVAWALEVPGVTRAWCYPSEMGAGTVTVRFVRDGDPGGLIPDAGAVATVQAYIDARRPVTATLYVVAPVAAPVNFQIGLAPNSAAGQAAVKAELTDLLQREAIPGGTVLRSHLDAAISAAAGETDHTMPLPAANVVNAVGAISTMGEVAWL